MSLERSKQIKGGKICNHQNVYKNNYLVIVHFKTTFPNLYDCHHNWKKYPKFIFF